MVGSRISSGLPPGFRFHPTDEELIIYYLRNQATSRSCSVSIIPEVDIYKFDPCQLPDKAEFGEKEWYFFTPRDRKYPNSVPPNRAAVSGYWKATGTDKVIYSVSKYVGVKKALVFYKGRVKTDWTIRLNESRSQPCKQNVSARPNLIDNYMGSSISQFLNDNSSYNVNVAFNNQENDNGGFSRAHQKLQFGQAVTNRNPMCIRQRL